MDARSAVRTHRPVSLSPAQLVRLAAGSLLALLLAAAILVCARRASGALTEPLPPAILILASGLLTAAALGFRALFPFSPWAKPNAWAWAMWAAPSAMILLAALGLSLPETSGLGLVGLWSLLLLQEGWSWGRVWQMNPAGPETATAPPRHGASALEPAQAAVLQTSPLGVAPLGLAPTGVADERDGLISQQIVRRSQEDGSEVMEGWVRADVAPGQRYVMAHVAICPPLDRVPECFAEQIDGPAAQVKVGEILPYGARFEIKLDQPAEERASVVVEFSIQHPPAA